MPQQCQCKMAQELCNGGSLQALIAVRITFVRCKSSGASADSGTLVGSKGPETSCSVEAVSHQFATSRDLEY